VFGSVVEARAMMSRLSVTNLSPNAAGDNNRKKQTAANTSAASAVEESGLSISDDSVELTEVLETEKFPKASNSCSNSSTTAEFFSHGVYVEELRENALEAFGGTIFLRHFAKSA
jgi:hypothetical protein